MSFKRNDIWYKCLAWWHVDLILVKFVGHTKLQMPPEKTRFIFRLRVQWSLVNAVSAKLLRSRPDQKLQVNNNWHWNWPVINSLTYLLTRRFLCRRRGVSVFLWSRRRVGRECQLIDSWLDVSRLDNDTPTQLRFTATAFVRRTQRYPQA